MMNIQANAKINLTLDILGRRSDGYHDLVMVMQSVGLCDEVTVNLNDSGAITVKSSSQELKDDESNIAYKAAKAFFAHSGISGQGAAIELDKRIPMEAGMAGGSADGAAVIRALNELCGTGYDDAVLWQIGEKVGADVPFCITGGTMLAEGKGERLSPLPSLSDFAEPPYLVLCRPDVGVSTGKAYAAVNNCPAGRLLHPDTEGMKQALSEQDIAGVAKRLCNVFEQVLPLPECEAIKRAMLAHGALGACMTGSGTTVFGVFDKEAAAVPCADALKTTYRHTYLTRPAPCGCRIVTP